MKIKTFERGAQSPPTLTPPHTQHRKTKEKPLIGSLRNPFSPNLVELCHGLLVGGILAAPLQLLHLLQRTRQLLFQQLGVPGSVPDGHRTKSWSVWCCCDTKWERNSKKGKKILTGKQMITTRNIQNQ